MTTEEILKKLEGKSQNEILLETTVAYLSRLPEELEDAAYKCAILRWFNVEILEEMRSVSALHGGMSIPRDSIVPTVPLYKQLKELPFIEDYPDRGYSFHDLTREVILDYLWHKEPEFYRTVSTKAKEYFQTLLEAQIIQRESGATDSGEVDQEIIVEIAYHYIASNVAEAIMEIEVLLEELIQDHQLGVYHAVLQAVTEHAVAGRMSQSQARIIELWRLREAYESHDIKRLEEIAKGLLQTSGTNVTSKIKADATYWLALGLGKASRYDEAYQYLEENVRQYESLDDHEGILNARSGLGDVEFCLENFDSAMDHFTNVLLLSVQQDPEFEDDLSLRLLSPDAWHRQELFLTDDSEEEGEASISPETYNGGFQEANIMYFVEIDDDEIDSTIADYGKGEVPALWPIHIDSFMASLWLKLGEIYQAKDNFDMAAACGRLSGDIFMDLNDLSGARDALELLQSLGASVGDLDYVKSSHEFQNELLNEAAEQGDKRTLLDGLINQAWSYNNDGKYEKARVKYKEAYSIAESLNLPNHKAICLNGLAGKSWIDGNYDFAEKQFKTSITLYDEVQNKEGMAQTFLSLGELNKERGRIQNAIDNYLSASEIYEELRIFSGKIDCLLGLSKLKKNQGDFKAALRYLNQALSFSREKKRLSTEAGVLSEIGKLHLSLDKIYKAKKAYDLALDISHRIGKQSLTVEILIGKAQVLSDMARYTEAIKVLDQVIEIDPSEREAHAARGWALEYLGRDYAVESRKSYEKAVELVAKDWWLHEGIAHTFWLAGDKKAAISKYQWVVDQIKEDTKPSMLHTLAWSYFHLGEYQKAEKTYRLVVGSELVRSSDYFDIGLVLICTKRYSDALKTYKKGIKLLRQIYPLRCRLGPIHVAKCDLQETLESNPEFMDVKQCIEIKVLLKEEWEFASTKKALTSPKRRKQVPRKMQKK